MKSMEITAVGIDVSKRKSTVAIRRPGGVIVACPSHKDNSVFCFMDKKRAEGKHYYVYTIAGSAKFLRIYYARVSEYLRTQEPPAAAICLDCKD